MKLAIRGHATRGSEVIRLLEMLGGNNRHDYCACCESMYFYIKKETNVIYYGWVTYHSDKDECLLTLEQFLEKFKYKVGDKINLNGDEVDITGLYWDGTANEIIYEGINVKSGREYDCINVKDMQPYTEQKEESMEENKYRLDACDDDKLATEVTGRDYKLVALDNYLIGKVTTVENGMIVEYVKKQPQYPKTYKECCKILGMQSNLFLQLKSQSDGDEVEEKSYGYAIAHKMNALYELLICRDAYWKIAGDWKPDWADGSSTKYVVTCVRNEIQCQNASEYQRTLAFPTKEMRNAFYENFKELIESCKELL